jgi:hypothetical protein
MPLLRTLRAFYREGNAPFGLVANVRNSRVE